MHRGRALFSLAAMAAASQLAVRMQPHVRAAPPYIHASIRGPHAMHMRSGRGRRACIYMIQPPIYIYIYIYICIDMCGCGRRARMHVWPACMDARPCMYRCNVRGLSRRWCNGFEQPRLLSAPIVGPP